MAFIIDDLFKQEVAKCAPENHRDYNDKLDVLWCPWAYKIVKVVANFCDWPVCNGCMRPVDLESAKKHHGHD